MSLWLRGLVWFGLYVAVALLPLGAALRAAPFDASRAPLLEFSVGLGFVAFAAALIQFALVSRLRASSRPFGSDALIQFHQQMGLVCFGLALAHPLLLAGRGVGPAAWLPFAGSPLTRTGALAFWALALLAATSAFRRRLRLSYEAWQVLHLALALLLAAALVAHVWTARGYSRSPVMRGLIAAYAAAAAVLALRYRVFRPLLLRRRPWSVAENVGVGGDTRLLRLRPAGHEGIAFEPGQFAWLITGRSPLVSQQHPLSIASSAEPAADRSIQFAVKALGDWSGGTVPALAAGANVWVDGPFGAFTTERASGQGFVMIAGGIGIAPLRSMLLTMRDRGDRREALLLYAVREPSRALFGAELEELRRDLRLRVTYVFEKPPDGWTGERGRITTELLRRNLPGQFRRFHYFICGPVPMMDALEDSLTALGIPSGSISSERFEMG